MSTRRRQERRAAKSQRQAKSFYLSNVSRKLAMLTVKAFSGEGEETAEDELFELIEEHLEAGGDPVFDKALEVLAQREEHLPLCDTLLEAIEYTAENVSLVATDKDGKESSCEAALLAIPVIIPVPVGPDGMSAPHEITDGSVLVEAMRHHGLIGPGTEVGLHPVLHHYEQVDLPSSDRRSALWGMLDALGGKPFAFPEPELLEDGSYSPGTAVLTLRVLVCLAVTPSDAERAPFRPILEEEHLEEDLDRIAADWADKCQTWEEAAGEELSRQLGLPGVVVLSPEGMGSGIRGGLLAVRSMHLCCVLEQAKIKNGGEGQGLFAAISIFGGQDGKSVDGLGIEVRNGAGEVLCDCPWEIHPGVDDPQETFSMIKGFLDEAGIGYADLANEKGA